MDVAETCKLSKFHEHHRNTHHEGGTHGNMSDGEEGSEGEDHHGGQRVRC